MSKLSNINGTNILFFFTIIFFMMSFHQKTNASTKVDIESETAILIDGTTNEILWEKDSEKKMYPASVTKMITAIVAIEEGNLHDVVTASEDVMDVIGTRVYLLPGEEVSMLKLIQGLMINSGNDAGLAIAEHIDGSEEAFAKRMNRFVREEIGVTNSNFTNPHGLFDEEHYTTAHDLALITQYAMENDTFREIVQTKEMEWIGEGWETTIYNHNRMLWEYEGVTGVKNGFVQRSGFTLSTAVERDDTELIAVTLNAPTSQASYHDMKMLFDYGFDTYKTHTLSEEKQFKDETGQKYELLSDVYFVTKQEERIEYDVTSKGMLKVRGEGDRLIKEVQLEPHQNETKVVPLVEQPTEQGFIQWLLQFFPLFVNKVSN
ncbi:D-alanyl-D-alanine carboxypeptidase family protein [Alkalihalophilus lindianensis]|uniref:D-alanyl-D-alanine carboxypeptidase family protein n=1 Tax=Alkalihalophilus lindianensis TaxID=1630542 RepID=A0ABU3XAY3_9BACI|nr:D-alanyl-D-alanine carboxypeptidase family protein [Alkalihalophilus lindianensis]MDV2685040.1 D-alanyl-D-alanine carboxypeptidase family protein [Alkalihalophilus lindianensis]